jgi:hypothetical protein
MAAQDMIVTFNQGVKMETSGYSKESLKKIEL